MAFLRVSGNLRARATVGSRLFFARSAFYPPASWTAYGSYSLRSVWLEYSLLSYPCAVMFQPFQMFRIRFCGGRGNNRLSDCQRLIQTPLTLSKRCAVLFVIVACFLVCRFVLFDSMLITKFVFPNLSTNFLAVNN